jgi:putative addiction module antidote
LRDADAAVFAHALFALFLFFEQLPLPGGVAAVAFGGDVLAERANRLSRDDLAADRDLCYNIRINTQLKITKIGNSAGVVLPKELLAHLDVSIGETLSVSKTANGIELSPLEPDFNPQMAAAREVMARRKRALRELAATEEELAEAIMREDRYILQALAGSAKRR